MLARRLFVLLLTFLLIIVFLITRAYYLLLLIVLLFSMMLISLLAVLAIKIVGDASRTYGAFGGEDLLVVCTMLYWIGDYINFRINHKNKKKMLHWYL